MSVIPSPETPLGPFMLKNPFLLSSGPPTASSEQIGRAFRAGWAGAVIKTIRPDGMVIEDLPPRFTALKAGTGRCMALKTSNS